MDDEEVTAFVTLLIKREGPLFHLTQCSILLLMSRVFCAGHGQMMFMAGIVPRGSWCRASCLFTDSP